MNKLLISISLQLFLTAGYSQVSQKSVLNSSNLTLNQIKSSMQVYFDSLHQVFGDSVFMGEGTEYAEYKRFINYFEPRLSANVSFDDFFRSQLVTVNNQVLSSSWKEIGPNNTLTTGIGTTEFISFYDDGTTASTQHMLTGSLAGGLFYSDNAGENWSPAGSDTKWGRSGCSYAVFHPSNNEWWYASTSGNSTTGNSLWIGYDGGVYRTTNKGSTWDQICSYVDMENDVWNIIYKIAISYGSSDVMYIASSNGLYRSSDYNSPNPTWVKTLNGFVYDIEVKPGSPNHLYATVFDDVINGQIHFGTVPKWYIMESNDYGQTWSDVVSQPKEIVSNDKCSFTIEVSKAKPNFLYCLAKSNSISDLFYIDLNNSTSWVFSTSFSNQKYGAGHSFGVDQSNDGNSVFVSYDVYGKRFNISTNSLASFNATHADIEDIVCHPYNTNEVWVAHHGGVDKSLNNGPSCVSKSNGLNVAQVMRMANSRTTSDLVSVGLYHDGTAITNTSYGINWTPSWRFLLGGDGMKTLIDYLDPSQMWISWQYGNWHHSNDNFNQNDDSKTLMSDWQTEGELNRCNPEIIYRIGENVTPVRSKKIQRSFDNGTTNTVISTAINTSIYSDFIFWELYPSENFCDILYSTLIETNTNGTYFHLYKTSNANSTTQIVNWEELEIPDTRWITTVVPDKSNPNIVYLVYSNSENIYSYPNSVGQVYKIDYTDVQNPVYQDITYDLSYSFTGSGCLELMNSVDNSIYLSTDIGVFYINDYLMTQQNKWHLVGSGFPHISSNGLDINYPSGKLRVGTMGRGVWEADIPCEKFPETANITQDAIWDDYMIINRNVCIRSGVTLTVTSSGFIKLLDDVKIVVEPGAKLIVDGGTLTNNCGDFWQGIELQGNNDLSQLTPGAQGQVILKNGAVIENAMDGITTIGKVENPENWDWSKTGGIIKAENSTFRNCRRGIQFLSYENIHPKFGNILPNMSYIKNCTFETTAALPDDIAPYAFISMYEVNGVKIMGNTFQNVHPSANVFELGNGIISIDAKYSVTPICNSGTLPCTSYDKNEFINLGYGIRASATNDMRPITVKNAVFNECHFGIYASTIDFSSIINNEFIISEWTNGMTKIMTYGYGLYLNQCKHFKVEGNYFHSSPTSTGWTGMYVNNTNIGDLSVTNEVYRNKFENLYSGMVALNNNGGPHQPDGVTFHCDTFYSNTYDIAVLPQPENPSISIIQGVHNFQHPNVKLFVRNWYTADCTPNDENQFKIDYINDVGDYIFHDTYNQTEYMPQCHDDHVDVHGIDGFTPQTGDCPCKDGYTPSEIKDNLVQVAIKKNEINNLVDGGQTNYLVGIAQSNIPSGQILQTMLEFSPYLSDEVLLALIERPNALPAGTIQQILSANSPLSTEVFTAVQNMHPSLPRGIYNQVAVLQTGEMSQRDMLPVIDAAYTQQERLLKADLIRYYLNDTTSVQPLDSVKKILAESSVIESKMNLVSTYLESKNFNKATALIDSLRIVDNSLNTFASKQALSVQVAVLPGTNYAILEDSLLMNELNTQALDTLSYGSLYAINTLEWLNDSLHEELTLIPMPGGNYRSQVETQSHSIIDFINATLKCYPNPAKEKFNVKYELTPVCSAYYLVVQNVKGQEVQRVYLENCEGEIELIAPAEPGTYYVYIEDCGRTLAVDKVVIVK